MTINTPEVLVIVVLIIQPFHLGGDSKILNMSVGIHIISQQLFPVLHHDVIAIISIGLSFVLLLPVIN